MLLSRRLPRLIDDSCTNYIRIGEVQIISPAKSIWPRTVCWVSRERERPVATLRLSIAFRDTCTSDLHGWRKYKRIVGNNPCLYVVHSHNSCRLRCGLLLGDILADLFHIQCFDFGDQVGQCALR